ncbi:MAG TPA: hypothetical protein VLJ39_07290 [Tepidisphaeraceae bacterium]|nr:hypothetical protein [Tepidisphaeraceae bacterium]
MTLRNRLACALVLSCGLLVSRGSAQTRNNTANNNPLAGAIQQIHDAETALKKAQADVTKARDKVKTELRKKPEWATVATDQLKAESDLKTTYKKAIDAVRGKPEYLALVKDREEADKVRKAADASSVPGSGDEKVSQADLDAANDKYIKAGLQMKAMEKQAVADDQAYNDAKARLDAANAKLAQMDAEVDETLKTDQDYQQLATALTAAQDQLKQAKDGLTQQRQQIAQQRAQESRSRSQSNNNR